MLTQLLELAALGRAVRRQEALAHQHRAEAPGARMHVAPALDADKLKRATTEIQYAAIDQRGGVDSRQIAVARLGLATEHADRQPEALARPREELLGVVGVADRARGDRVDRAAVQAARVAEVGEHLERGQRPLHRLLAEATARQHSLTDAHRLGDLVRAPPPAPPRP